MSRLSGIDLTAIYCKSNTVREYLLVLVLPINEETVSVDLLVYFSVLYTLNSVPFWGLTSYNKCLIHAKNVWLQLHGFPNPLNKSMASS